MVRGCPCPHHENGHRDDMVLSSFGIAKFMSPGVDICRISSLVPSCHAAWSVNNILLVRHICLGIYLEVLGIDAFVDFVEDVRDFGIPNIFEEKDG